MSKPVTPIAVANHLLNKGDDIDVLKLIKLVYLCHGWHLAVEGKPLLSEQAQAWRNGPVLPSLYFAVRRFGNNAVTPPIIEGLDGIKNDVTDLAPAQARVVDEVYRNYKKYDGVDLSELTHEKGTPWYAAWHAGEGRNVTILDEDIRQHYLTI